MASERETYHAWLGRTDTARDIVTERLVQSLRATLECERHFPLRRNQMPLTLQWCLAPAIAPMSGLGADGHAARGGFLPLIPELPRRMWAGSEMEILAPLAVGDAVERVSRIADLEFKEGRTGLLCFVRVDHEISNQKGVVIRERQDIVYRQAAGGAASSGDSTRAHPEAEHSLTLYADTVLLFRYSALTFNSHRIHYDRDYATGSEHYDGLVVHGPLQASFLMEFAAELAGGNGPRKFSFRGLRPLIDGAIFVLKARKSDDGMILWIENAGGEVTMNARAAW